MTDQQNTNNENEVVRESFGSKVKGGLVKAWNFTRPARVYVLDVAGTMVCCAAAGAATVGGIVFMANKLNITDDQEAEENATSDVSAEDTTPEE